jgi:hypothetical protein
MACAKKEDEEGVVRVSLSLISISGRRRRKGMLLSR